jgi:hypothetical protein
LWNYETGTVYKVLSTEVVLEANASDIYLLYWIEGTTQIIICDNNGIAWMYDYAADVLVNNFTLQ